MDAEFFLYSSPQLDFFKQKYLVEKRAPVTLVTEVTGKMKSLLGLSTLYGSKLN